MAIVKGDKVLVITGKERNKSGIVEKVLPKKGRVVVAGLNMVKKHLKKSAKQPQGGIIDKEASLHISNVMLLDQAKDKPTRIGYRFEGKKKVRFSRLTNQVIETKVKNA